MTIEQRVAQLERNKCCGKPKYYDTFEDFPTTGVDNTLYVDESTGNIYVWDGDSYITADEVVLQGFDTMDDAITALGLGKQFYYNAANLDGATAGSIHITI